MLFTETALSGAYVIQLEPLTDQRGGFARSFCKREFEQLGLKNNFVQCNISFNHHEGTIRGLHYQEHPYEESKVVYVRRGAIFDVIVDLRKASPTYGKWIGIDLSVQNNRALYIPEGFAHGFQTLKDDTELFYLMGNYYCPEAVRGLRWDDSTFNITWPLDNVIISERDKALPRFEP